MDLCTSYVVDAKNRSLLFWFVQLALITSQFNGIGIRSLLYIADSWIEIIWKRTYPEAKSMIWPGNTCLPKILIDPLLLFFFFRLFDRRLTLAIASRCFSSNPTANFIYMFFFRWTILSVWIYTCINIFFFFRDFTFYFIIFILYFFCQMIVNGKSSVTLTRSRETKRRVTNWLHKLHSFV